MIQNNQPDCSLKQVFESAFFPALGYQPEDLREVFEAFYVDVFPSLRSLTQLHPEAVEFVNQAVERGFRLAVATSPLFPRTAILQRLDWAGLSPEEVPFELVTSYEDFHFAKPNLAYFAEVLARLGWSEGPVIMVGDDLHNDIYPSRRLGLPAYWITTAGTTFPDGPESPTASGTIGEILPWLDETPINALLPDYTAPEAILAVLRSTPAALDSLSNGLPPSLWVESPQAGEWSLTQILCHLRDGDREVHLPRLIKVLEEQNPFLPGIDTDPWAEERQYNAQDGQDALLRFTEQRIQLLNLLENLPLADWRRRARHAIFGPTQLIELISFIAGHDRLHVHQAYAAIDTLSHCTLAY
jgi:FMN phosphatase YigB (HAD superfamily)